MRGGGKEVTIFYTIILLCIIMKEKHMKPKMADFNLRVTQQNHTQALNYGAK